MADKLYWDNSRFSIFFDPTPGNLGYYFVTDNHLSLRRYEMINDAIAEAEKFLG